MKIVADLHLHSRYSRAVSQQMELETMAQWALKKGVNLLGTADFTHPLWFREIKTKLKEVFPGIYQLKTAPSPYFVISGEISSIYTQNGQQHRIHNLVLPPNFSAAEAIIKALEKRGANLHSDGRPIIGLSSIQLAELVFSTAPEAIIIPCHIWTPWFSLYGSRSGFDSLKECFGPFSEKITAIETGLSSDPTMNWQIEELTNRQIVSFSDAHSPIKIGREATVFEGEKETFSFSALKAGLENKEGGLKILFTIEFYPEEGKYHYSGHSRCQVRRSPEEIQKQGNLCPVCGKPLTLGVAYRVYQLAKKTISSVKKEKNGVVFQYHPDGSRPPFVTLVPLVEIIAEAEQSTPTSQKVISLYEEMITQLGDEFSILLDTPLEKLTSLFGPRIGEGIEKVRKREIFIEPGYDGVFGTVKIWSEQEKEVKKENQMSLF